MHSSKCTGGGVSLFQEVSVWSDVSVLRGLCLGWGLCSDRDLHPPPPVADPLQAEPPVDADPSVMWPVMHTGKPTPPPPVDRMTHTCKNITLPETSFASGKYRAYCVFRFRLKRRVLDSTRTGVWVRWWCEWTAWISAPTPTGGTSSSSPTQPTWTTPMIHSTCNAQFHLQKRVKFCWKRQKWSYNVLLYWLEIIPKKGYSVGFVHTSQKRQRLKNTRKRWKKKFHQTSKKSFARCESVLSLHVAGPKAPRDTVLPLGSMPPAPGSAKDSTPGMRRHSF